MKIAVVGTGHLADATSENCAEWFELGNPGEADLIWFCVDTPVDANDEPDVESVLGRLRALLAETPIQTPILISSQLPVGTCARAEQEFPHHHLAVQPENIRKAHAAEDFRSQDRIVIGTRHPEDREIISEVCSKFSRELIFMSPESAEMVKHALNCFLAMEIAFANEIADVCQQVNADPTDVFRGFRSDWRVGDGPLNPGGPYRGGTLGRDVTVLTRVQSSSMPLTLVTAIKASNDRRL